MIIDWINENNGFLMVIITLVYVIATVFICVFNGKSAKASREQIIASQKQQEQNAGLQLYSIRREIINKMVLRIKRTPATKNSRYETCRNCRSTFNCQWTKPPT